MNVESMPQTAPNASEAPARGDRVARTREAIVGSTLSLALEGEVAPIVRDIAKLAGASAPRGAKPLNFNQFKIPLMTGLVARAVRGAKA